MKAMFSGFLQFQKLVGISTSQDLCDFLACFQLMGEETPKGEAARNKGFRVADPNDSGRKFCSLAMLESFALSTLLRKYPKVPPDSKGHTKTMFKKVKHKHPKVERRGQTLYELFRPCYIKAFTDAKDHKKGNGEVKSGKEEFRLFCAYLCIHASMVRQLHHKRGLFWKVGKLCSHNNTDRV